MMFTGLPEGPRVKSLEGATSEAVKCLLGICSGRRANGQARWNKGYRRLVVLRERQGQHLGSERGQWLDDQQRKVRG